MNLYWSMIRAEFVLAAFKKLMGMIISLDQWVTFWKDIVVSDWIRDINKNREDGDDQMLLIRNWLGLVSRSGRIGTIPYKMC